MWSTFKDNCSNVIYIQRYCSSQMWSTFKDIAHHTCDLHSKILLITHVIYIQRYCSSKMWSTFKEIDHHTYDLHSKIIAQMWTTFKDNCSLNVDHIFDEQYLWMLIIFVMSNIFECRSHVWWAVIFECRSHLSSYLWM
jgi:hypothetical protein